MFLPNNIKRLFSKSFKLICFGLIVINVFACSPKVDSDLLGNTALDTSLLPISHTFTDIVVGLDESRRTVNLSVTYPMGKAKYPLIVFSHGHALDNLSYRNLTNYWAKRGFVVVAPLHLDSGGDLAAMAGIAEQYGRDWIAASRLIEMSAVIDQIQNIVSAIEDFNGEVLVDKVIAAGHSFGALSSQQLSGANLELQGDSIYPVPINHVDERIVAVVAISPPGLIKDSLSEKTWQGYSTPQLVVTGPNDFFPYVWPNYEDHFVSYLAAEEGDNYLLVLDEMDHYLGNLIGRLERDGPPQTLALENLSRISLLFIQHYLSLEMNTDSPKETLPLSNIKGISNINGVLRYEHR